MYSGNSSITCVFRLRKDLRHLYTEICVGKFEWDTDICVSKNDFSGDNDTLKKSIRNDI